ncbi:MAG: hypothetical protein E5Y31_15735 [Mesorhizobium sp.]|nr:MAG: hypothetical protein E5Y31_15735 [Mesorhizobium sp.]
MVPPPRHTVLGIALLCPICFYAIPKRYALFPGKPLHTFSGIASGNQQGGPRQNDPAFYTTAYRMPKRP